MLYARLDNAVRKKSPDDVWDEIAVVLEGLADGRDELDAVRHPLGFLCLPIVRDDSPEGVCLHYWSGAGGTPDLTTSPYHCHRWQLLSHVLAGSVGNLRVDLTPGGRYRLFEVISKGRNDELRPTDRLTDIRYAEPEFHRAGETYELAAGAFHASVMSGGEVAVTLVLGRMVPGVADISLGAVDKGEHPVVRTSLGPGRAGRLAAEILRLRPRRPVTAGSAA
jgi:hypothetical protein